MPESVMMGRETLAVKLKDSSPQDTTSTNVGQKMLCVRERVGHLAVTHLAVARSLMDLVWKLVSATGRSLHQF